MAATPGSVSKALSTVEDIDAEVVTRRGPCADKAACTLLKLNLLKFFSHAMLPVTSSHPALLVSEVLETARCPDEGLKDVRREYVARLSAPLLHKIFNAHALTPHEEFEAASTVVHCHMSTYNAVYNSLPWPSRVCFHTGHNIERLLAVVGVAALVAKLPLFSSK